MFSFNQKNSERAIRVSSNDQDIFCMINSSVSDLMRLLAILLFLHTTKQSFYYKI